MSNEQPSLPAPRHWPATVRVLRRFASTLASSVRAVSFWLAVVLPVALLLALAAGLADSHPGWLAALLATNVLCAVLGHGHARGDERA